MKRNRKKRNLKLALIFLLVLVGGFYYAYNQGYLEPMIKENKIFKIPVERKNLKAYDIYSNKRPFAVMIDNIKPAWPQSGLGDAFLIYEVIVEGGQTRLMALFKDQETLKIGPIRSARHYFLDYAMESDAIFVHFGGSPKAYTDIKSLRVNDLDGMTISTLTERDRNRPAPHNVYGAISDFEKAAANKKYTLTTNKDPLLNYSFSNVELSKKEDATVANSVKAVYSKFHTTNYVYNVEKKVYTRSMNGVTHKDRVTGETYEFKNIIIVKVENDPLIDNSGKDRQELYTVGSGNGFYVTNGYYIPITWSKTSRGAQTIFRDASGSEIKINDGKTFIQVQPKTQTTTIS